MRQDFWNQLDLAPAGLFVVQRAIFYSSLAVTFSRTGENLTSGKITN